MFSKSNKPKAPEAAAVPVPPLPDLKASAANATAPAKVSTPSRAASTLASDLVFEGNITGGGELNVDGTVRGDIRVGRLVVGETGNVEGSVQGDYVEIRGRVVGGVTGKQVKLMSTAYVDGDISHEQLSIDVGAYFQGRCLQGRKGDTPAQQQQAMGFSAPAYSAPQPAPTAQAADTGQLIELKPAG